MPTECRNCGEEVGGSFARVMGDNDNRVWACPECATFTELCDGAAGNPDVEVTPSA